MAAPSSASPASEAKYNFVSDPIYSIMDQVPSVDRDTQRRSTRRIPAAAGGSATAANGGLAGKETKFTFGNGSNYKMRWDTTALVVRLLFSAADDDATNITTKVSPPWNLFGSLINEITLLFNASGTPIYTKSNKAYKPCFTARMLRHYSMEQLNKKSEFLFTPVSGDKELLYPHANATMYDNGGDLIKYSAPVDNHSAYAKVVSSSAPTVVEAEAAAAVFGEKFNTAGAYERYQNYIGTNSSNRIRTLVIPFADLFPRMIGNPKNLRNIDLTIKWNDNQDLLEKAGPAGTGFVHILGAEILTDDYIMSHTQAAGVLDEKMAQAADHLCFMDTDITHPMWQGPDLVKTSLRNLDSVMMLQFADDVLNHAAGANYKSSGQFLLLNGQCADATTWRVSNTAPGTANLGPESFQIEYGDVVYPSQPLSLVNPGTTANTKIQDYSGIYMEYLKALGRVSDRTVGAPLSLETFSRTMPFIWIKPFATDALKLSEAKDLMIHLTGTPPTVSSAASFYLICFCPKQFTIAVDGTISEVKL